MKNLKYLPLFSLILLIACQPSLEEMKNIEAGVSKKLADARKASISNVLYKLHFDIPDDHNLPLSGIADISFDYAEVNHLVLDFKNDSKAVSKVQMDGEDVYYEVINEHIVVPSKFFQKGSNQVHIEFTAGNKALNRNKEYLYTLFVPDRASTAFPCFDQPNVKAKYDLSLSVPAEWEAVANGALINETEEEGKRILTYEQTLPISTYLFAFAAGKFTKVTQTIAGQQMTMYHRETDEEKIKANSDAIFDLHYKSIQWLEDYTDIPLPFPKFDFVLIPAFQFGGMEHPGAIFYRAQSLMLELSATKNQKLGRNSLIAHETAHMWFGDLVTMDWFDDVWLKEVFANFFAAKMVNPNFPDINHDLRFLLRHYPSAYGEDRSEGTHPIQQQLDNLNEASTLYGRLIYQKAPVVMKQLEIITGEENFRDGMREYLKTYSFDNATWDDLIDILDKRTNLDLPVWSEAWVKEKGMPHVEVDLKTKDGKISSLQMVQRKATPSMNQWQQDIQIQMVKDGTTTFLPLSMTQKSSIVSGVRDMPAPDYVLPNGKGIGYGYFQMDENSIVYLLKNVQNIEDDLSRSIAWMNLWESFLRGGITPESMLFALKNSIPNEKEPLGLEGRLRYLHSIYWGFISPDRRMELAEEWEDLLWTQINKSKDKSSRYLLLDKYIEMTLTQEGIDRLEKLWKGDLEIPNLSLSESHKTTLAYELAIREVKDAKSILNEQYEAIKNPDRKDEMEFVIPVFSKDTAIRDAFFESLKTVDNRTHEPWVLKAIDYLHHPLRAESAEKYILPSLELVEPIQQTGGIFFPRRWASNTLRGHSSKEAAEIVRQFLTENPDYNFRLKNKILMSADMLFRKAENGGR